MCGRQELHVHKRLAMTLTHTLSECVCQSGLSGPGPADQALNWGGVKPGYNAIWIQMQYDDCYLLHVREIDQSPGCWLPLSDEKAAKLEKGVTVSDKYKPLIKG